MTNSLRKAVNRFNRTMQVCEDMNVLEIKEDGTLQAYYDSYFKPSSIDELIKESKYQLSLYYEGGHSLEELYYENNKEWHRRVNMLKRLINSLKKIKTEEEK